MMGRMVRRFRGVAPAALVLGMGVGIFTLAYSIADSILWSPLVGDPENRAVHLAAVSSDGVHRYPYFSYPHSGRFAEMPCWDAFARVEDGSPANVVHLTGGQFPDQVFSANVSPSFFQVLQIPLLAGRFFQPESVLADGVLVSEGLWRSRLGSAASLAEANLMMDGIRVPVIGVFSGRWHWESPMGGRVQILAPLASPSAEEADLPSYRMLGRPRSGASGERDCQSRADQVFQAEMRTPNGFAARMEVRSLKEQRVADTRTFLLVFLAVSLLILLLTMLNTFGLALIDRERRAREEVVKKVLGAPWTALLGNQLGHALILGLCSAGVALLVAWGGLLLSLRLLPSGVPRADEIGMGLSSLAVAALLCLSGALATLGVHALGGEAEYAGLLRQTDSRQMSWKAAVRLRGVVAGEIAIAAALLLSGVLMLQSYSNVSSMPLGYEYEGIYAAKVHLPIEAKETSAEFFRRLLEWAQASPLLDSAALTTSVPLKPRDYKLSAGWRLRRISGGFFKALGVSLEEGRSFQESDQQGSAEVTVISRSVARSAFPAGRALDGMLLDRYRVVGIVPDLHYSSPGSAASPAVYLHYLQSPDPRMALLMRSPADPEILLTGLRDFLGRLDPEQPVTGFHGLEDLYRRSEAVETRLFFVRLLLAFSLAGLVLAGAGIHLISSLTLMLRRHEFGVRKALGATPAMILRQSLSFSLRLTMGGALVGLAMGIALAHMLSAYLFRISAFHPPAVALVFFSLLVLALFSGFLPGLSASRQSPKSALTSD